MGKQTKLPSDAELKEVRERLSKGPASKVLPKDAFAIDRLMKFLNAIYPNAEIKINVAS